MGRSGPLPARVARFGATSQRFSRREGQVHATRRLTIRERVTPSEGLQSRSFRDAPTRIVATRAQATLMFYDSL